MENKEANLLIGQEFPQNCGDTLKILEIKKVLSSKGYYETKYLCVFLKYPCEVLKRKYEILKGTVPNLKKEEEEFTKKLWEQNCGDTLEIKEKTAKLDKFGHPLYKCQFLKYPYIIERTKSDIKKGQVNNPLIEEEEFVGKVFPQNKDSVKVICKLPSEGGRSKYKCQFLKYPYEFEITSKQKQDLILGKIDNPKAPWKSSILLREFIEKEFSTNKPTLSELSKALDLSLSFVSNIVINYNLKDKLNYYTNEEEESLRQYCLSLNKGFEKDSYWLNSYQEIDIYSPLLKFGIEYNGAYWHSELYKEPNYHQEKTLQAHQEEIDLIHVFSYEWNQNRQQIEAIIKSKSGIFDKKINARQCQIKEISNKEYQDFCQNNHLQGICGAKIKIGLFYKEELVQIMSFGKPRFTDQYEWEVIRECSKLNYLIVGGKSKLWKYFLKKEDPNSVISYCDFSKFNGKSYLSLGFKFERLNKPGFVWWDENNKMVYWRNPYQNQEMKNKGYCKIYDCGQLVFVWRKG